MQAALSHPAALSADAETRLRTFATLLLRWTQRINLISRNDQAHVWERHVLDCVRLAPFLPPGTERAIDLGSGAGLPGLVLAIATGIPFDLVESDRRKAAFLTEAASVTQAPVTVHCGRIEAVSLAPAAVVTARALAPLPDLLGLAAPHVAPGGMMLFPKGAQVWGEIEAARKAWRFEQRVVGGAVPSQFHGSVEKGVRAQAERGVSQDGRPLVDVAVVLVDGKAHSVDSSDAAFQTAGALALREVVAAAGTRVLEPWV